MADAEGNAAPATKAAVARVLTGAVERGDSPAVVGLVVDRGGILLEGAAGKFDAARDVP